MDNEFEPNKPNNRAAFLRKKELHLSKDALILTIGRSIKERRIDKYLHCRFSNYSRVELQKLIRNGSAKVNGSLVKPSFKLSPGDRIDLFLPQTPEKEIPPENIPLDIIHEDDDIIIINKQADLIVHPARGNTHGTLVNALVFYTNKLSSGLGELRPGIVHRLDRNTTGVMVVAKNDDAQSKIAKQFQERQVHKSYLAVVHGRPELIADRIQASLGVHPQVRKKYAIREQTGKKSITNYKIIEEFVGFSLLKLSPETGRTHQIRIHLSYIKHPIVGDDMYGGKMVYRWQLANEKASAEEPIISRPALHALCIGFKHPATGKNVNFEAPMPKDMKNLLDMLRQYRS
ncbi:RluA family pseudouridine synthase [Planctomycetota bacterium]